MAEYIEKNAMVKLLDAEYQALSGKFNDYYAGYQHATHIAKNIPADDVAPVIRCRDCENTTTYKNRLMCYIWEQQVEENDFCSRGERKEE